MSRARPQLTIGSSALNEEESLEHVVQDWLKRVPSFAPDFEIVLVNDGSTDQTGDIMERLAADVPQIRVIHHPYNLGFRGFANTLVNNARGELFAGVSCDGEVPIGVIGEMMERIEAGADVVVGNRVRKSGYTSYRKFVSNSYNGLVKAVFGEEFGDIGAVKLFRTHILKEMPTVSRSAFMNAERLLKAARLGYRIERHPIDHLPRIGGKARGASFRWVRDSTVDLVRVAWHMRHDDWRPPMKGST